MLETSGDNPPEVTRATSSVSLSLSQGDVALRATSPLEQALRLSTADICRLVAKHAYRICRGRQHDAEEVAQEATQKLVKWSMNEPGEVEEPLAFLYTTVWHAYLDEEKRKARENHVSLNPDIDVVDPSPGPEYIGEVRADAARLFQLVKKLPKREHREIINAIIISGMSWVEASRHLAVPEATLRSRMQSAMKEMRNLDRRSGSGGSHER